MPCLFIFKLTTKILGEKSRSPQSECLHLARYFATNLWEPLLLMVHALREEILVFNAIGSWISSDIYNIHKDKWSWTDCPVNEPGAGGSLWSLICVRCRFHQDPKRKLSFS
jgi:hypothetical protein